MTTRIPRKHDALHNIASVVFHIWLETCLNGFIHKYLVYTLTSSTATFEQTEISKSRRKPICGKMRCLWKTRIQ